MDDYLFSTFLAEELLSSLTDVDKSVKNSVKKLYENDLVRLEMSAIFRTAVYNLMIQKHACVHSYHADFVLVYRNQITIQNFNRFATDTALEFFQKGYSPALFIAYCAVVVELALFCHDKNLENVFEQAIGIIGTVLTGYVLLDKSADEEKDIFTSLVKQARRFNEGIKRIEV
ncbi:hypothetical protein TNCT_267471 [Trichonephila clavata]|uniref:Uncharacterized protein n=1 Tax=Trichonephila clavata TaxID=2740835 RepID=A0A8X6K7N8_TRICU|nr:hypothetical protein TNCT_267471 [Trichonephila clavata]